MKIKLLLITIIFLLSISCVWAENDNQTFLDVQNALNTDSNIIYLNNSNYVGKGQEITINDDIILDGAYRNGSGQSSLDGNGLSGIVNIKGNCTVILKNINFINGNNNDDGGAISFESNGSLIIINCNFTNNTGANGGAIYCEGELNLYDVNFLNNTCTKTAGAIYVKNNTIHTTNSYFTSNYDKNNIETYFEIGKINNYYLNTNLPINLNLNQIGSSDYQLLTYNPSYNGSLPSKYDLRELNLTSPIYNQGNTGTCWAQAALATLQSCILKADGVDLFNECNKLSVENLLNLVRDNIVSIDYYNGGLFEYALPYFTSWMGPIYEDDDPWIGYYKNSTIMNSIIHIQNAYNLPARNGYTDIEPLKKAIMDYGAVYTTCYANDGYHNTFGDYYHPQKRTANHAVTIVGWDDNYSRYNFKPVYDQYPEGDGAFIVQNSWGQAWGRQGFYYVSYYDGSIYKDSERAWTFILNDSLRYSKNYQNEIKGKGSVARLGTSVTAKNTFTAEEDDYLVAVSTYFTMTCNYKIQIYVNGESKLIQDGFHNQDGYYTLELNKYIPIKKGDIFTVALTYSSLNEDFIQFFYSPNQQIPPIKAFTSQHLFESIQNKIDKASENSEIFLNNKTYFASLGEKTLVINKNITINGATYNNEGFSTLDACNLISIFKISDGCVATFKNLNLINSNNFAINGSNINIINSNFANNNGKYSVYILKNGNISNCIFNDSLYNGGVCNLTNNTMKNGIYNNGTIISKTNLVFPNITTTVNKTITITASLTDDNNNPININQLNIENIGFMKYNAGKWFLEYTPHSIGQYILTSNIESFSNLNVVKGSIIVKKVKISANLKLNGENSSYGKNITIITTLNSNASGIIEFYLDNNPLENKTINQGLCKIDLNNLKVGNHTILAIYKGDDNFLNQTTTIQINIVKAPNNITYEILNNTLLKVYGPKDNNSYCKIQINNVEYLINLTNGEGEVNLNSLETGKYAFKIKYYGENYIINNLDGNLEIKTQYKILTENIEMYYLDGTILKATLIDLKGNKITKETINITLNNQNYTRTTNENGSITFQIKLPAGSYNATLTWKNISEHVNILIKSKIIADNLTKYFQNKSDYSIKVLDNDGSSLNNCTLELNINGMFYNRTTDENGMATLKINLPAGNYIITVKNLKDNEIHSNNITVLPTIYGNNLTKYFQNDSQYSVKVLDTNGKPNKNTTVEFNINGVFYKRNTDENGIATLKINLPVGKYIITSNYNSCLISNNITVLTIIKSDNLQMTNSKRSPFIVIVVDKQGKIATGKKLSFNINGIIYNRISNENGSAELKINLPLGEYIITTNYDGFLKSNTITIKD